MRREEGDKRGGEGLEDPKIHSVALLINLTSIVEHQNDEVKCKGIGVQRTAKIEFHIDGA